MSLDKEDQGILEKARETFRASQKQSRFSYTREFLLSLSELDVCQNLPSGFDQSILSEFEDTSQGIQDQPRISGPFQGFRRSEYSSSPPTRGDSGNNSRGIYGRWDSRSSGRSDRDSDSQSDLDSDSGKRYGNQSQRSWQNPEHNGLLGSGSFPRPSACAAGISPPKVRAHDHYQLNKSNEPYHPPRPYKAGPHSRRETNDSYNDETFGSSECTSEDKAEEEKIRRASFELMRKEQQKALQEKQKLNIDKHKNDSVSDIAMLLDDAKVEERLLVKNNELDLPVTQPVSDNDSGKSSILSQVLPSRPLVPPGFTGPIMEKNAGAKSLVLPRSTEVGELDIERSLLHTNVNPMQNGSLGNQEDRHSRPKMGLSEQLPEDKNTHGLFHDKVEKIGNSFSGSEVTNKKLGVDKHLYGTASISEPHDDFYNGEIIEFNAKKVAGDKIVGDSNHENSSSLLQNIFGSGVTANIGGTYSEVQHHDSKQGDMQSPTTVQSSKFSQWFSEEGKKPSDGLSSGGPTDLLSLIVCGEKGGSHVSDVKSTLHIPSEFSYPSSEFSNRILISNAPSITTSTSEHLYNCIKQEVVPAVLTCEDLEQTIMSEYSEKSSTLEPSVQTWSVSGEKTERQKANVDGGASQYLLSLLQMGTQPNYMASPPIIDTGSLDKRGVAEGSSIDTALHMPPEENAENVHYSGKTLTLETLFGSAFMTELKSVEAPVSVQRGSVGSTRTDVLVPHGPSIPVLDDGSFPCTVDEIGGHRTSHESIVLASNHRQQTKLDTVNNWLGFDDPQIEVDSSKLKNEVSSKHNGLDRTVEIQLPEEESLIAIGDSVNFPNSMFMPDGISSKGQLLPSNKPVDISEKLAALNANFKDEQNMVGREGPSFVHGSFDLVEPEIPFHNLHAQSSQFNLPQISQGRPLFHPLDSHPAHINSKMKFMAPENIIHHDTPTNHKFSSNLLHPPFQHPNTGLTGFDLPAHHQMLQQMQMPSNFPLPHLPHEFPRGTPLSLRPSIQATGFMHGPNLMQRFPFGHRQPNFGGLGAPLQALDVTSGDHNPEVIQRLIEMELRENTKQIHPTFPVGRSQGRYGPELDMGFRYR